jgi:hypothetical protein
LYSTFHTRNQQLLYTFYHHSLERPNFLQDVTQLTKNLPFYLLNLCDGIGWLWFLEKFIQSWRDFNIKIRKLSWRQQYRAWSDYMYMQSSLASYWWQRLITYGSSSVRAMRVHWHLSWPLCVFAFWDYRLFKLQGLQYKNGDNQ